MLHGVLLRGCCMLHLCVVLLGAVVACRLQDRDVRLDAVPAGRSARDRRAADGPAVPRVLRAVGPAGGVLLLGRERRLRGKQGIVGTRLRVLPPSTAGFHHSEYVRVLE